MSMWLQVEYKTTVVSVLICILVCDVQQLSSSPGSGRPHGTLDNAAAMSQEAEVKVDNKY